MTARNDMLEAARKLRNIEPDTYDYFLAAYQDRANATIMGMTTATNAEILVKQGQSQEALAFLRILKDAKLDPKTQP